MFQGYLGELCAVHENDRPTIVRVLDSICAVSDTQTCAEVHMDATNFSVNPSFACRVVVCTGPPITPQVPAFRNMTLVIHCVSKCTKEHLLAGTFAVSSNVRVSVTVYPTMLTFADP